MLLGAQSELSLSHLMPVDLVWLERLMLGGAWLFFLGLC
jgi:hypothetical protein